MFTNEWTECIVSSGRRPLGRGGHSSHYFEWPPNPTSAAPLRAVCIFGGVDAFGVLQPNLCVARLTDGGANAERCAYRCHMDEVALPPFSNAARTNHCAALAPVRDPSSPTRDIFVFGGCSYLPQPAMALQPFGLLRLSLNSAVSVSDGPDPVVGTVSASFDAPAFVGQLPPSRQSAASCSFQSGGAHYFVVVGGATMDGVVRTDAHIFCFETATWSPLANAPSLGREMASCVFLSPGASLVDVDGGAPSSTSGTVAGVLVVVGGRCSVGPKMDIPIVHCRKSANSNDHNDESALPAASWTATTTEALSVINVGAAQCCRLCHTAVPLSDSFDGDGRRRCIGMLIGGIDPSVGNVPLDVQMVVEWPTEEVDRAGEPRLAVSCFPVPRSVVGANGRADAVEFGLGHSMTQVITVRCGAVDDLFAVTGLFPDSASFRLEIYVKRKMS